MANTLNFRFDPLGLTLQMTLEEQRRVQLPLGVGNSLLAHRLTLNLRGKLVQSLGAPLEASLQTQRLSAKPQAPLQCDWSLHWLVGNADFVNLNLVEALPVWPPS